MTRADGSYLLVVFDTIDDPDAVREALCQSLDLHPTDAMQWIARMPGVGTRVFGRRQAEDALDRLYELGIAAEARTLDAMPSLTPVRTVHDVACLAEGFRVKGLRGEPIHWVPWEKIDLINAAWVEQPDETRAVGAPTWSAALRDAINTVAGRPHKVLGRRPRTMRTPREPKREIMIVRREPQLALRLCEEALNYSYLEQRLCPTASENFPLLLDDLCRAARAAYLPASTKALWKGGEEESKQHLVASSQELLDDTVLRLLWVWYKRDRERDLENPSAE